VTGSSAPRPVSVQLLARHPEPDGSTEARVEVDDPAVPCRILLAFTVDPSGACRLTSVELRARPPGAELDPDVLATIPLARHLLLARNRLRTTEPLPPDVGATTRSRAGGTPPGRPPTTSAVEAEDLARVASTYREAMASPDRRARLAPTAAVARAFGVDRTAAGRLVARARRAGLLNAALPRRPGEVPPEGSAGRNG
jgi:hypothetical protein